MKTREEAAKEYVESKETWTAGAYDGHHEGFLAGIEWLESQASESFVDFWQEGEWLNYLGNYHRDEVAKEIWQSARLSAQKEMAEKDAEIERLKLHDIAGYEEGIACLSKHLQEAKDLVREMREIMSWRPYAGYEWTEANADKIKSLLGEDSK